MARYAQHPAHISEALQEITPSDGGSITYYPCKVTLKDARIFHAVYIEPEKPYFRVWGVYPEDDKGKQSLRIEEVELVEESQKRLPPQFANEVYRSGESGMGYTIFTVVFSDGLRQAYVTGNAVDFITYPEGKGPQNVVSVEPHVGRNENPLRAPQWFWCLYSE